MAMGKIAVIDHAGTKITLSMIKFGLPRRILLSIARKFQMVDPYRFPAFIPRYEIAVFNGGPKVVFSLSTPDVVFYYPDEDTATRKWTELSVAIQQDGLFGKAVDHFIRYAHPHEQGVHHPALEKYFAEHLRG